MRVFLDKHSSEGIGGGEQQQQRREQQTLKEKVVPDDGVVDMSDQLMKVIDCELEGTPAFCGFNCPCERFVSVALFLNLVI